MPIYCNEINQYIQLVDSGKVLISDENRLLLDNIVIPLLSSEDIIFDNETYQKCIKYVEKFFYKLVPFQKFLYAFHFMYDSDNNLVFNEYIYVMGRGNGKDGLVAPLVNFFMTEYFGVQKYNIDIVATAEDQAYDTFEVVKSMMLSDEHKSLMKANFTINDERIINKKTLSKLKYNTANSKTKDGKGPGCVVFNEFHGYENYDNVKVHVSGLGKVPKGRRIIITTEGNVRGGPLDDYIGFSLDKLNGKLPKLKLFPFICRMKKEEKNSPELFEKANPFINYNSSLKATIYDEFEKIKIMPSLRVEFYVKRLNIIEQEEDKCVASWEKILKCNKEISDTTGYPCVVGIDYAEIRDMASVVYEVYKDKKFIVKQHSWFNLNSPTKDLIKYDIEEAVRRGEITLVNTPTIDPKIIVEYIVELTTKHSIVAICMDTFRYNIFKQYFDEYGIYPRDKNNPDGLIVLVRNGVYTHSKVAPQIDIKFENELYIWGSDRTMNWFVNNTAVKTDGKGNKEYYKINPLTRKNDGFMALVHCETEVSNIIIDETLDDDIEIF